MDLILLKSALILVVCVLLILKLAWDTHNYLQSLDALMLRMALVDTLLLTVVVLVLAMWPKPSALEMLKSESFLEQQRGRSDER